MKIGVLKSPNDRRVGLVPETVGKLIKQEHTIMLESGAGKDAFFADAVYQEAGASIETRTHILKEADVIISVNPATEEELQSLRADQFALSLFNPLGNPELAEKLKSMNVNAMSLDRIPRTTIAQSMDILSSMASLAGYKAVLVAANHLPGYFPMMMTAAGTIPPARVLVLGAGVAGLQAIATARRLGAIVEAFDVRAAVKEEVESLGAKFVEVEGATEDQEAGGYAVTQTEEYQRKQKALIHEKASKSDAIITTAQIPGRKAPLLVEAATVKAMKAGSVIIDMAASSGGNCELTEDGKTVEKEGVILVGEVDFPSQMCNHASRMMSNNIYNFVQYVFKEGIEGLDEENEIVAGTLIK